MKFRTCPECGASLDFGERCDCRRESEERARKWEQLTKTEHGGQIAMLPDRLKENGKNEK